MDLQREFTRVFYFYSKVISVFHSENSETLSKRGRKLEKQGSNSQYTSVCRTFLHGIQQLNSNAKGFN